MAGTGPGGSGYPTRRLPLERMKQIADVVRYAPKNGRGRQRGFPVGMHDLVVRCEDHLKGRVMPACIGRCEVRRARRSAHRPVCQTTRRPLLCPAVRRFACRDYRIFERRQFGRISRLADRREAVHESRGDRLAGDVRRGAPHLDAQFPIGDDAAGICRCALQLRDGRRLASHGRFVELGWIYFDLRSSPVFTSVI